MKLKWIRWSMAGVAALAMAVGAMQIVRAQEEGTKRRIDVSPRAETVQRIGVYDVKVIYHRPGVKGREIWNTNIVPYGGKPMPWRAGANENTIMSFESDVKIEGKKLPKGEYGFHTIPTETTWTLIWSKDSKGWGSFRYKPENDALRVEVTPEEGPHEEWLRYGFDDLTATSATGYLAWEKKRIPFRIELDTAE
jgi:hypothetical protein